MKVSRNWLQSYLSTPLPEPKEVARLLTFHSFEVESFEAVGDDVLFEVAVLPNRAHDALSHWSIAWELSVLLGIPRVPFLKGTITEDASVRSYAVQIEDTAVCTRYTARLLEGVAVGDSPSWVKDRLATIGQRSINSAVDFANYVMFSVGQPMHVFDADKVVGDTLFVRFALAGERITTLDRKEVALDPSILVIADAEGPLAIAGIKGGTRAEVDAHTKNIIIESAHFEGSHIRRTAKQLGIRTDASLRFEHGISAHLAEVGMAYLSELLQASRVGKITDIYPVPEEKHTITVTPADVERLLGVALSEKEIADILMRIGFVWTEGFHVEVPPTRLDLRITADMVEEIGRIYGYEKIAGLVVPKKPQPPVLKSYFYAEMLRAVLAEKGCSEIYGYSFGAIGERELQNPLAEGRGFMRTNLSAGLSERLAFNLRNKDILGLDDVLLFEIGTVYLAVGEATHVAVISSSKKTKVNELLPWPVENMYKGTENCVEFNLSKLLATLPDPATYADAEHATLDATGYRTFSPYPFVSRDIAVFVPVTVSADEVRAVIEKEKGTLCVLGPRLFDTFTKTFPDGSQKTSYAFRLVFQASDRTLVGEETNAIMEAVTHALASHEGWQVR